MVAWNESRAQLDTSDVKERINKWRVFLGRARAKLGC
jgi:hypothetical protein